MRDRVRWISFAVCLGVVIWGLTHLTLAALRSQASELEADARAEVEENLRLTLYRMELAAIPIVTRETSRPPVLYQPFYTPEYAYSQSYTNQRDVQLPSPLLGSQGPDVLVHFRLDRDGRLGSPQAPEGNEQVLAEGRGFTTSEQIAAARAHLARLQSRLDFATLQRELPPPETVVGRPGNREPADPPSEEKVAAVCQVDANRNEPDSQQLINDREWTARNGAVGACQSVPDQACGAPMELVDLSTGCSSDPTVGQLPESITPVDQRVGDMHALWVGDDLLLARRVTEGDREVIQGCALNWPHIEGTLVSTSKELMPDAALVPRAWDENEDPSECLAVLPVRLVAGTPQSFFSNQPNSTVGLSLQVAWISAIVAAVAIAILLFGAFLLHERRRRFVSAVTHELRTPLTTFRLYTEMLSSDMVAEDKRTDYLGRLHREANRLGHLVENVLAYARLEETGECGCVLERVTINELIGRVERCLRDRAAQEGLELQVSVGECGDQSVHTDLRAVERILFNLVDNACRYGKPAKEARIDIDIARSRSAVRISVRDTGPGVPVEKQDGLFRAFDKAPGQTTSKSPGVGLGLALCKGLAQQLGGDLELTRTGPDGTTFSFEIAAS
ncbi:MAG: HAMP domain-containing sensor histidine kinase [Planctomycetota bacterium]